MLQRVTSFLCKSIIGIDLRNTPQECLRYGVDVKCRDQHSKTFGLEPLDLGIGVVTAYLQAE